jgi:L-asparaginase II
MRAGKGRVAIKAGAEGYFAAIVPEAGLGVAIKCDDGASRAAETIIAAVLDKLGLVPDEKEAREFLRAPIRNTRNEIVGERRPAPALAQAAITAL